MPAELGGSQISSLLESLPGIASVLRSPVADALVKAIRAGAGIGEFVLEDAEELVRYAVRRGLVGPPRGGPGLAPGPPPPQGNPKSAPPPPQRQTQKKAAYKKTRP